MQLQTSPSRGVCVGLSRFKFKNIFLLRTRDSFVRNNRLLHFFKLGRRPPRKSLIPIHQLHQLGAVLAIEGREGGEGARL